MLTRTPHLLVTRPQAQAESMCEALRALGFEAQALPLIQIDPLDDVAPIEAAWRGLSQRHWVFFVSPNAVRHFFEARPLTVAHPWPTELQAGAVGPGTAMALRDAGVPASQLTSPPLGLPQVDSEALWTQLAHHAWAARQVLIVRGDGGRDWLADQLKSQGAQVAFLQVYARSLPRWSAPEQSAMQAAMDRPARHLWLFSSSQAIAHLQQLGPPGDTVWHGAHALATHPRITERARAAGFGRVLQAAPDLEALAACIQSAAW